MTYQQKIRISLIFVLLSSSYGALIFRLFYLQIKQHDFYSAMAHQQYAVSITQLPPRAEILDRNGTPLALNKESVAAFTTPRSLKNKKALVNFLRKNFPEACKRFEKHADTHFMYIKRRLSDEEIKIIERAKLEDIFFLQEPSRFYPVESVGPIVGITNIDNEGLFGVEGLYNTQLAGTPSHVTLERDARSGKYFFNAQTIDVGSLGKPVTLTIDSDLQFFAYEELKKTVTDWASKEGAVLIMDPTNGDILAMAHYPDFDPNCTHELDQELVRNKIITDAFELGSVMKIFMALAAIEEKVVTPDEIIDCENSKTALVNGVPINTWKAHGELTFTEIIEFSNNIGTSKVAMRLGQKLYDHYRSLGFGSKTGINFPGEQRGAINPPNLWSKQSVLSLSFGYEIAATLLQLARAFSVFIDGTLVTPRLVNDGTPVRKTKTSYTAETIRTLRDMIHKTVTEGTARKANIDGYTVLGKTGTANLIVNGHYDPDKNIFTFTGAVEKGDYKRIIVTFIRESTHKDVYASSIAAPLFERVAHNMIVHERAI